MISLEEYLASGQTTVSNLFLTNYARLGLSTFECMLWLQLSAASQKGDDFPDLVKVADSMGIGTEKAYDLLGDLINKGFVALETVPDENGRQKDRYNLLPAYDRLAILKEQERFQEEQLTEEQAIKKMYQSFEQEFGRPLSAIEYQRIGQWLEEDHYAPDLIALALREAVLNQAYNLTYIDRVLLSWERKNIRTKQQVEEEQKRRKQILLQKEEVKGAEELPKVSLYNWLKENDSDAK
ncbi:DnaD domain-containing protein [Enterococcus pallens]|uniref:DnaD domain-containing protein n=1 Tax=Enterococcus pallens TaxID=160454 RepID=UPI0009003EE9|nr:DnaD domain protein [Enterococcus pallens]OJG81520.1 DnaD domain-containing protein [Enterococcus pallens]